MKTTTLVCLILCSSTAALAFLPPAAQTPISTTRIEAATAGPSSSGDDDDDSSLEMPLTYDEMIRQAARCISDAQRDLGASRQVVRVLLPRRAEYQSRPGETIEGDADLDDRARSNEMKLVPPDESWQGGIMQLYRAARPVAEDLLRGMSSTFRDAGVPPRIVEDRSVDESGVDGVGLCYTRSGGGESDAGIVGQDAGGFLGGGAALPSLSDGDNCIFVQPSQEAAESIDRLSTQSSPESLIALLNPRWRDVDDALDSASKTDNIFGSLASFLGGKGSVLRRLEDLGYIPTYTLEGYVCKGGNVRLLKRFDSDWAVFAEKDKARGDYASSYVKLGNMAERPSYQDVESMLDDKGIGYKYARDLGMAPKL